MAVKNGVPDDVLGADYPFQDKYVDVGGSTMHYIEAGRAGLRRPTILLLHGNPTWSFLYRKFMEPLSKVARVIAVDHVGFGRSDHPADPSYHTLEQHIQNLEGFCKALKLKRVIPVVQDWGGPIGLGWATRHPESVAGLVIMNTWAFTEHEPLKLGAPFKALKAKGVGEYMFGNRNLFVERFIPKLLMAPPEPGVMDAYRHPFPNRQSRAALVGTPRMIPTSSKHPDWATMDAIEKALPGLNVPARILWGAKDPAFGKRYAHAFHSLLPNAEPPEFFDDAGHWLQEDIPERLVAHIRDFVKA